MEIEEKIENTFSKHERLCSDKSIDRLFAKGKSFIAYPLRVVYLVKDEDLKSNKGYETTISLLISVSKRKFKRAVKRNRVKRLIREAYRLNKHDLQSFLENKHITIDIALLYLKDELPTYAEIEKSILKIKDTLFEEYKEKE